MHRHCYDATSVTSDGYGSAARPDPATRCDSVATTDSAVSLAIDHIKRCIHRVYQMHTHYAGTETTPCRTDRHSISKGTSARWDSPGNGPRTRYSPVTNCAAMRMAAL